MCYFFNILVKCHLQEEKSYFTTKNYWTWNDDGIITDGYNTCDTNLALKKQWTRGIPLMLSFNIFLKSCYPYDCYFNSFVKVFLMCSVKACVFYQLSSFLQDIICVWFYWRKMVEYLLRYESDKKEINQLVWACLLFVPGNQCLGTGTKWCCVHTMSTRYVTVYKVNFSQTPFLSWSLAARTKQWTASKVQKQCEHKSPVLTFAPEYKGSISS